jgi:hypothetical protein
LTQVELVNCVAAENAATQTGAAIYLLEGAPGDSCTLRNTTVVDNATRARPIAAGTVGDSRGAIAVGVFRLTLVNSIVYGNTVSPLTPGMDVYVDAPSAVLTLDHSDTGDVLVEDGTRVDAGGNLQLDPQLEGIHLGPTSRLIDAGTCVGAPSTDVDGDPRPTGAGCDIGADERVP